MTNLLSFMLYTICNIAYTSTAMQCVFDDDGSAILIHFSNHTNSVAINEKFSCLTILTRSSFNDIDGITQNSHCYWNDNNTLRIKLGYKFDISTSNASYLELIENNISPHTGYCKIQPMQNISSIRINIIGSRHLCSCDNLYLSAAATIGQVIPMQWKWLINSNNIDSINAINGIECSNIIKYDQQTFEIPGKCFGSIRTDTEYDVMLIANNKYYPTETVTKNITIFIKSQTQLPCIQLLASPIIYITLQNDLIVPIFIKANNNKYNCSDEYTVYDRSLFQFEWISLSYDPINVFDNANVSVTHLSDKFMLNTKYSQSLFVPATAFEMNKYYLFQVMVTFNDMFQNIEYVGVIVSENTQFMNYIKPAISHGPSGGICSVSLYDSIHSIYLIECTDWTSTYVSQNGLEYSFMLLNVCKFNQDCDGELVCQERVCVLENIGPIQTYLRQWTNANFHYFNLQCTESNSYVIRSFIRNYYDIITTFDVEFTVNSTYSDSYIDYINEIVSQIEQSILKKDVSSFSTLINAFDSITDCVLLATNNFIDRSFIVNQINNMFNELIDMDQTANSFYNHFHFILNIMNQIFYDYKQFTNTSLEILTNSDANIANQTFEIIETIIEISNNKSNHIIIDKELSTLMLISMSWSVKAAMQQTSLYKTNALKILQKRYYENIINIVEIMLTKTHYYNVSFAELSVDAGYKSTISECTNDIIDPFIDQQTNMSYVQCIFIEFKTDIVSKTPIIYSNLKGFTNDGTEIDKFQQMNECNPYLYTIPHTINVSKSFNKPFIMFPVCKNIIEPASDCYVSYYNSNKTVCACNTHYSFLTVDTEIYYPQFTSVYTRQTVEYSWTSQMETVCASLWLLVWIFAYSFCFYIVPGADWLDWEEYQNRNEQSTAEMEEPNQKHSCSNFMFSNGLFCVHRVFGNQIDENISNYLKTSLSLLYFLLVSYLIALFYVHEMERMFPDCVFAIIIPFILVIPIWLIIWSISKIKPYPKQKYLLWHIREIREQLYQEAQERWEREEQEDKNGEENEQLPEYKETIDIEMTTYENKLNDLAKTLMNNEHEKEYSPLKSNAVAKDSINESAKETHYWCPKYFIYICWLLLICVICLLIHLFLLEGNKLGEQFLWIPQEIEIINCRNYSITPQKAILDYEYSLYESEKRNPACSPQEFYGSMPNCWDYRLRFVISGLISLLISTMFLNNTILCLQS